MKLARRVKNTKPIKYSLMEYGRGIGGGTLFSLPLLYTMEVWWAGFFLTPLPLIGLIMFTFILVMGLNYFAGLRPDASLLEVFFDSVESMGLGFIVAWLLLLVLNRISPAFMHFNEIMGKIIIEAMAVTIGISIGKSQLGSSDKPTKKRKEEKQQRREKLKGRNQLWGIMALGTCGTVLIAGTVAATDEILLLGVEGEPVHVLWMAIVSVAISILIVYFSGFKGAPKFGSEDNKPFVIVFGSSVSYFTALVISALMLWFFGRFDSLSLWSSVALTVALGMPASIGASAARLLIK